MAYKITKYELRKGYIVIDSSALLNDVKKAYKQHNCEHPELTSFSAIIENEGISNSVISNSMHAYERTERRLSGLSNYEIVNKLYPTENYQNSRIGIMQNIYYNTLLRLFHLDDIYRIPTREELKKNKSCEVSTEEETPNVVITKQDIDELRTDLRMLTKSIVLLSETLSANLKQKPSAVLPKKEVLIK